MKTVNFKKEQLEIVKIWCSVKNRVPHYIISNFFEFTGTLVSESIIEAETNQIKNNDNVPTFYLSPNIPNNRDKKICYIDTSAECWNNVTLENCSLKILGGQTEEGKSIAFLPIIEYMKQVTEEFPEEIYSKLWNIFIESNLVKALKNLEFYASLCRSWEHIHAISEQIILKCIDSINSLEDASLKDSFQYKFAEIYLKVKHRRVCNFQLESDDIWDLMQFGDIRKYYVFRKGGRYRISDLIEIINELLKIYKENINLLSLEAKLASWASDGQGLAFNLYNALLKKLKSYEGQCECYNEIRSEIYQKKGLMFQKFADQPYSPDYGSTEMKECFAKSFLSSGSYKNTFKIGYVYKLSEKDFKSALEFWLKSKEFLSVYLEGEINLNEMYFYFETCRLICETLYDRKLYEDAIDYGLEATNFFEEVIKNRDSYRKTYGDDVEIYLKASIELFDTGSFGELITKIIIAHQKIGDKQKSDFLHKKLRDPNYFSSTK